jgi:Smg protein
MTEHDDDLLDMLLQLCSYQTLSGEEIQLDYNELLPELESQGFDRSTVLSALDWISDLVTDLDKKEVGGRSTRVFSTEERTFLDTSARNCLIKLENMGILNSVTRERVIDQVMALQKIGLDASLIKWVAYLVLCSHPEQGGKELDRMELLVADTFLGGVQ